MEFHPLLRKQISKFLTQDCLSHPQFEPFITAVNASYLAFERDKELSTHAFLVTEEEYSRMNERLKAEIALKKLSILRLKEAINNIEEVNGPSLQCEEDNLLDILHYLDLQIQQRIAAEHELTAAKEAAEKASMAKTEFLSTMSHEIRTPLNAVIGMSHLLLRNDPKPEQVSNLHILKTSAQNLLTLINDILDFDKIESGKIELEETDFNLRNLVASIRAGNLVKAHERGNTIRLMLDADLPSVVIGDGLRISQVLTNLVSNAVKFTQQGNVTIEVNLQARKAGKVAIQFSVTDTGIGIPEDKLHTIFEKFSQAHPSTSRNYGGTGLGLSITQKLLHLMDSEVHVHSTLGKGSTFSFVLWLPAGEEPQRSFLPEAVPPVEYDLQAIRILLVEDTPFNIVFATQLLQGWNSHVDVAEDGSIAVAKLQDHCYDIVLMDLLMPNLNGYDATTKIREFDQETPIIALTASASSDVKQAVTSVGMQDYVTKPFNPGELYRKIRRYAKAV